MGHTIRVDYEIRKALDGAISPERMPQFRDVFNAGLACGNKKGEVRDLRIKLNGAKRVLARAIKIELLTRDEATALLREVFQ